MRDDTDWHFHHPKPGDRFYELNNYIEVQSVSSAGTILVAEFTPEPRLRAFRDSNEFRLAYRRSAAPGYIVRYHGNEREH